MKVQKKELLAVILIILMAFVLIIPLFGKSIINLIKETKL